jgi:hypothetical protein
MASRPRRMAGMAKKPGPRPKKPRKPKLGRPRLPNGMAHTERYTFRFRKDFLSWLRNFAGREKKTPGQVMVDFTVEGAKKKGEEPPEP